MEKEIEKTLRHADGEGVEAVRVEDAREVGVRDGRLPAKLHQPVEGDRVLRLDDAAREGARGLVRVGLALQIM